MKLSVFRMAHFNAAHRLNNPQWDEETNKSVFGPCNNEYYHGHNYELEVRVTGEVDPNTGYVYDLGKLARIIDEHIEKKLDHKNLNLQVEEFKTLIPSAEHIAFVIYNILRLHIEPEYEIGVKLWETPRNYVQYPA
ncbi:MAG: 6-carboxytetrahydropterin synthase [Saprospiraceae bacterium]|nr:6-carboxytetrahydropterin synthase [Saprospiraceae bacterium]HOY11511.1 6-carboxytetrahydropterin synthase [Saprospiraceae bacterium]HPN70725.1 6-carboxytetrahydropterin synthase [Saprospiraceae bacterium]